jgi:hypothetical protein
VPPADLQTGSSISSGGKTYILQEDASYSFSGFSSGGTCANYTSNTANIQALRAGADYNTGNNVTFTASGGASGTGSAKGGTDDIVKVVTQSDIDGATGKITSADSDSIKQQLKANLASKGLQSVPSTFLAGDPLVTTSAQVGDKADNVTVTSVTTYTMLGVQKADLQKLVDANVTSHLDKGKQVILDDGVANAKFSQANPGTANTATVAMEAKSLAGPHIDATQLKKTLAGKKSGDVKSYIKQTPGVSDVDVHFSPFWVGSVPGNASKVTVNIVKAEN